MRYHIEGIKYQYGKLLVRGWAVGSVPEELPAVSVEGEHGPMEAELSRQERPDLQAAFFPEETAVGRYGFRIAFVASRERKPVLCISCGTEQKKVRLKLDSLFSGLEAGECWEEAGISGAAFKLKKKARQLLKPEAPNLQEPERGYLLSATGILPESRKNRLRALAGQAKQLSDRPLFSIVVPVYRPKEEHLRGMLDSVLNQVYDNWELCLAEASGDGGQILSVLKEYQRKDSRIKIKECPENKGISGNTNEAFSLASGEFTALLDHDDLLEPDALYEAARLFNEEPELDFIYTDSDLADEDAMEFHSPLHKTGWAEYTMLSANYVNHFSVLRTSVLRQIGGWQPRMDGAQDWDLYFRASEVTRKIGIIPKVLYHWRAADGSTAASLERKPYARKAQLLAVQEHLDRTGKRGRAVWEEEAGQIRIHWKDCPEYRVLTCDLQEGRNPEKMGFESADLDKGADRVWIFCGNGVEISAAAGEELAAVACQPEVGFVMPKLLSEDGRVKSLGLGTWFQGEANHSSNAYGSTDWYRNPEGIEGDCIAVSERVLRALPEIPPVLSLHWLREVSREISKKGLQNVMTPFAEVTVKE